MSTNDSGSLKKIYNNLCGCCAKPKDDCTRGHLRRSSIDDVDSARNRFESLALGYHNNVQPSTSPEVTTKNNKSEKKHSDNHSPRIVDDTLGEAFELRKEIQVDLSPSIFTSFADTTTHRKYMTY